MVSCTGYEALGHSEQGDPYEVNVWGWKNGSSGPMGGRSEKQSIESFIALNGE